MSEKTYPAALVDPLLAMLKYYLATGRAPHPVSLAHHWDALAKASGERPAAELVVGRIDVRDDDPWAPKGQAAFPARPWPWS